jgi:DNA-binding NtrC family response regulator
LIEDEVAVNRFVTTALSRHGYEVISADGVNKAWATFEQEQGRFDMVFSDAILPDGNGVELISRVLGRCPDMRTLLSSGYLDKDALLRLARERDISFLQKPYTLPALLRTVDDVLHDKRQAVLN